MVLFTDPAGLRRLNYSFLCGNQNFFGRMRCILCGFLSLLNIGGVLSVYLQLLNELIANGMGIKKEYSNGELTIIWQPEICVHAGVCFQTLPAVYRPSERPWIRIENATTEELIDQINHCPTGALSYRLEKK